MNKIKAHTKEKVSSKELLEFFAQKIKAEKEKEENRRMLMQKQLIEITGGKNIIISNYTK